MYRIKNTADDRTKHLLHRTSTRFELEPVLGSRRIRLGEHYDITNEHYEKVKHIIAPWVKNGMVDVIYMDEGITVKMDDVTPKLEYVVNAKAVDKLELANEPKVEEEMKTILDKELSREEKLEVTEIKEEPKKAGRPKKS